MNKIDAIIKECDKLAARMDALNKRADAVFSPKRADAGWDESKHKRAANGQFGSGGGGSGGGSGGGGSGGDKPKKETPGGATPQAKSNASFAEKKGFKYQEDMFHGDKLYTKGKNEILLKKDGSFTISHFDDKKMEVWGKPGESIDEAYKRYMKG